MQGMWAHNLTVEAYQELLDRGWRRSGRWLYRPQPDKLGCECCPYTIRLDAHKFRPSKVCGSASSSPRCCHPTRHASVSAHIWASKAGLPA